MSDAPRQPDDIFNDALDLPPEHRASFLEQACGGDPALLEELHELLRVAEEPSPDLERIGRYRILGELGRGGMGVVYRALDPDLGREIALKILPPEGATPRASHQLEQEARILATFSDPHIATIYSFEESDRVRFVTMELVDGETLAARVAKGRLSPDEAAAIVRQLVIALEIAHSRGVVHRDVKPGNVMVRRDGLVKVLDFGIARMFEDADPSAPQAPWGFGSRSGLQGTPAYISPEVLRGEGATPRSDLWAVGCVLFECVTGRRVSPPRLVPEAEGSSTIPEIPRSVPRALRRIITDCLREDPEQRLSSATRIRERLESYLTRGRRNTTAVAVLGAVVVLAVIGVTRLLQPGPALSSVEIVQHRILRGLDTTGSTLWQRDLGIAVYPNYVSEYNMVPHPILDVDGTERVYVGTDMKNGESAHLLSLDGRTGAVVWDRPVEWVSPVNEQGPIHCRWIFAMDAAAGPPALVMGIRDGPWYAMAIRTIRPDGSEIGTYYHPGALSLAEQVHLDDGRLAFLLFGGNSSARFRRDVVPFETRQHPGAVALVTPGTGAAQAFPYAEGLPVERDWPGMPRAQEEAYLLVPPLFDTCMTKVRTVEKVRGERREVAYQVKMFDGRFFAVDSWLRPLDCHLILDSPAESLYAAGSELPDVFVFRKGRMERVNAQPVPSREGRSAIRRK